MKNSFILLLTLVTISWYACVPPVVFSEPQPKGYNPQNSFPIYYRGTFLCDSDSSIVHIHGKTIFKEKEYELAATLEEIDSTPEIRLDGYNLYVEDFDQPFPINVVGDSVFGKMAVRDTLFQLGEKNVLTQFRGHQILNKKMSNGDWEVLILSMDYEFDLALSMAALPEDLDRLKEITPVTDLSQGDTLQFKISPTVYEFSQILDEELVFETCDYFKRIALPVEL